MKRSLLPLCALITLTCAPPVRADEVTDWNEILFQAALAAKTSPLLVTRNAAIVQGAVFDAVNGIEGRYAPVHVDPAAPRGASRRAAAVQAAYGTLALLYPTQTGTFDTRRAASLAAIAEDDDAEAIARGTSWGQSVAEAIWAWRSTDGLTPAPPPFLGGTDVGEWRPTPPAYAPGAGPQFATMTPWVIDSPSQFRPAGPPSLAGAQWAADFNETKTMGSLTSASRTADQTLASLFWNASSASYYWNQVAVSLAGQHHNTLSENARLLALLNIAMADAAIACWDAKYHYVFWRPVTAIPLGDTDGNSSTVQDPSWTPLFATPAHPEYPSGHSTISGAGVAVLARLFGENTPFSLTSDVMLGVVRSFTGFSPALDEVADARVFAGIHYRTACVDGRSLGAAVANHVLENALLPDRGAHPGQITHQPLMAVRPHPGD